MSLVSLSLSWSLEFDPMEVLLYESAKTVADLGSNMAFDMVHRGHVYRPGDIKDA